VHGGVVAYVNEGLTIPGVDGLITDKPNLFLTIVVADCLPIFLWDNHSRAIALLHAGWRGTTAQIAQNGVNQLIERFGIESKNITAILGPCICQRCYEVGPEVALNFDMAVLHKGSDDRSHLDLRYANFIQLVEAGVSEDSIYVDERCTCCNEEMFFSYRRDGENTGRMVAAIGIAPDYN
jgi:YfiH family protein